MDIFHCQRCGHWPMFSAETRQPYGITSCGGLCCAICVQEGRQTNKCPLCQGGCKIMEINSQANAEIKTYFMDPQTIIKESIQKTFQVMQFQYQLQKSAVRLIGSLMNYQKAVKAENQSLKLQITSLLKTQESMKEEMKSLQRQNADLKNTLNQQQSTSFRIPSSSPRQQNSANGDVFNFLRQSTPTDRPNAQVQPIQLSAQSAPHQRTPYPSPRSRERFTARETPSPAPPRSPMFCVPASFRYPRSTTQESTLSTPASIVSTPSTIGTLQSPDQFFMASSESPTLNNRSSQQTPDLIRRLRNIKWRQ